MYGSGKIDPPPMVNFEALIAPPAICAPVTWSVPIWLVVIVPVICPAVTDPIWPAVKVPVTWPAVMLVIWALLIDPVN